MAEITGSDAIVGFKPASTYMTAVQCAAGDGFGHNGLSQSLNAEKQSSSALGLGYGAPNDMRQGAISPTASINGTPTFNDGWANIISSFYGTATVSAEITASQGDYTHTFSYNKTRVFGTLAAESSTTTVIEYPSAFVQSLTVTGRPNQYLQVQADFFCGDREEATSVNTNANLASVNQTDTEEVYVAYDSSYFWVNAKSGSTLSSSNEVQVTEVIINLSRPLSTQPLIGGDNRVAQPRSSDLYTGTVQVTFETLQDHAYFTAARNSTAYKGLFGVEGTQIGTGLNKSMIFYFPHLKVVDDPRYDNTSAGVNPLTVTYDVLAVSSAPSGMSKTRAYAELTNERSTRYFS